MNRILFALAIGATVVTTSSVKADSNTVDFGNFYGRLDVGAIMADDVSFSATTFSGGATTSAGGEIEFDTGVTFSGAIGSQFSDLFAAEIEFGYGEFDYDQISGNLTITSGGNNTVIAGSENVDGSLEVFTGLVNGIVTPWGTETFSPYIGAGIGFASYKDEIKSVGDLAVNADDTNTAFLANGLLGLNYNISDQMSAGLKYRYLWVDSGENGVDDIAAHTFTAGLEYRF